MPNNVNWIGYSTDTTSASSSITWASTTSSSATYTTGSSRPQVRVGPQRRGDFEEGRQELRRAERELRRVERGSDEARERARALLRESLSQEQRQQYDEHGSFLARGSGGRRYLIRTGSVRNVVELDDDNQSVRGWCLHHNAMVPHEDVMLAQKLLIETDEQEFRRLANVTMFGALVGQVPEPWLEEGDGR